MLAMTLIDRVKKLKVGKSFYVDTESERTQALNAAKVLGRRITSRKLVKGGFTVTRLPGE
jgi:hypothetical protein